MFVKEGCTRNITRYITVMINGGMKNGSSESVS